MVKLTGLLNHCSQPDILDVFFTSISKHLKHNIQNSYEISSHYTPVILEINCSLTCKPF